MALRQPSLELLRVSRSLVADGNVIYLPKPYIDCTATDRLIFPKYQLIGQVYIWYMPVILLDRQAWLRKKANDAQWSHLRGSHF